MNGILLERSHVQPPEPGRGPRGLWPALAIVTDADDMEYAAVAAVARWTAQSEHVSYLLVTPLAYQSAPADA